MARTNFGRLLILFVMSWLMFVLATLMGLIEQMSGTPYITGGNSAAGTDCSGLASLVSNVATDRPAFGGRFNTGNEESALLARGFHYGTAPGALVIGWNGGHTAVTLPDGTPVSSGEGGGVRIGGGGAYQPQFIHHMYLPVDGDAPGDDSGSGPGEHAGSCAAGSGCRPGRCSASPAAGSGGRPRAGCRPGRCPGERSARAASSCLGVFRPRSARDSGRTGRAGRARRVRTYRPTSRCCPTVHAGGVPDNRRSRRGPAQ